MSDAASPAVEVEAELWAMDPAGLFYEEGPPVGVWITRTGEPSVMGETPIKARGPRDAVLQFIRDGWGDDEHDQWAEAWCRYPARVFSFADVELRG